MTIQLITQVHTVEKTMTGSDAFTVDTGKYLTITNDNTEIFKEKPTAGKQWSVVVTVRIEESSN